MNKWRIGLLLLLLGGCSQDPTEPPAPQKSVTISGPKQVLLDSTYQFKATVNFTSEAMLYARWRFDDSTIQAAATAASVHTLSHTFHSAGQHIIHVDILRTGDNAVMCSASDTIQAAEAFISISPDSIPAEPYQKIILRAIITKKKRAQHFRLDWAIDATHFIRTDVDTISCVFTKGGSHPITVICYDTGTRILATAKATVVIDPLPVFHISAASSSTTALSPIRFTATYKYSGGPTSVVWDFGDGVKQTADTSKSANHAFMTSGSLVVRASLYSGCTLLGADSVTMNVSPLTTGFSIAALSQFRRATAQFFGSGLVLPDVYALGLDFTADSLSWNGPAFSFSVVHSTSSGNVDSQGNGYKQSSSNHRHVNGRFSLNNSILDTIDAYMDNGSSNESYEHGLQSSYGRMAIARMQGSLLNIDWYTPDSMRCSFSGPVTKDHVTLYDNYKWGGYHSGGWYEWGYSGPDWNSTNPTPRVEVTFYKK